MVSNGFLCYAASIVSGAVAERVKLSSFFIFVVFLTGFIYPIQGSWSWGGGYLSEAGFLILLVHQLYMVLVVGLR